MKRLLFLFFLFFSSLQADIIFSGVCGSYDYNLSIKSKKYYGAFCDSSRLLVYYDGSGKRDYIRAVYTDPTYDSLDIYSISTGKWYQTYEYNHDSIKYVGDPSFHLLAGLAGLFVGFSFLYVVMRLV